MENVESVARFCHEPRLRRAGARAPRLHDALAAFGSSTVDLRFLTAVTAFQAPQNVAVERLWVETWLPYDDATVETCRRLAGD